MPGIASTKPQPAGKPARRTLTHTLIHPFSARAHGRPGTFQGETSFKFECTTCRCGLANEIPCETSVRFRLTDNAHLWAPGLLSRPDQLNSVNLYDQYGEEHVLFLHPQEANNLRTGDDDTALSLIQWRTGVFGVGDDILAYLEGYFDFTPENNRDFLDKQGRFEIPVFVEGVNYYFLFTDTESNTHCVPWFPASVPDSMAWQEALTFFTTKLVDALLPGVAVGPCPGRSHGAAMYNAEAARIRRFLDYTPPEPVQRTIIFDYTYDWGRTAAENHSFREYDNRHLFSSPGVLRVYSCKEFIGALLTDTEGQRIYLKHVKGRSARQWVRTLQRHIFPEALINSVNEVDGGLDEDTIDSLYLPRDVYVQIPPDLSYAPAVGEVWRVGADMDIHPIKGHPGVSISAPEGDDFSTRWSVCKGGMLRPIFVLGPLPHTLEELWLEWSDGFMGQPPVVALEHRYGPTWRQGIAGTRWFGPRKIFWELVQLHLDRGIPVQATIKSLKKKYGGHRPAHAIISHMMSARMSATHKKATLDENGNCNHISGPVPFFQGKNAQRPAVSPRLDRAETWEQGHSEKRENKRAYKEIIKTEPNPRTERGIKRRRRKTSMFQ